MTKTYLLLVAGALAIASGCATTTPPDYGYGAAYPPPQYCDPTIQACPPATYCPPGQACPAYGGAPGPYGYGPGPYAYGPAPAGTYVPPEAYGRGHRDEDDRDRDHPRDDRGKHGVRPAPAAPEHQHGDRGHDHD